MPEQHLYEYAVIRITPKVEREEFMNIGVVVYCARKKYLKAKISDDHTRLAAFAPHIDCVEINAYMTAFARICAGGKQAGPMGALPAAERFRWLTATRSSIVQTSKVHPGMAENPDDALERLYNELVA